MSEVLPIIVRTLVPIYLVLVTYNDASNDYCGNLTSRPEWGSVGPTGGSQITKPIEVIIFHHTVTPPCSTEPSCKEQLRSIQDFHKTTFGFDDIGYNFVVGGDGLVYEGRGWNHVGAHTKGHNSRSYGIAFIGDYTNQYPSEKMLKSIRDLIICGIKKGDISIDYGIYGASDFRCTESPGKMVYETLRSFVKWHGKGHNFKEGRFRLNVTKV